MLKSIFKKNDSSKILLGINNISTLIKSNLCLDPPEQEKWVQNIETKLISLQYDYSSWSSKLGRQIISATRSGWWVMLVFLVALPPLIDFHQMTTKPCVIAFLKMELT